MKRQKTTSLRNTARRGGAVIIVVLALLSSLAFIGLFFYALSDSERDVATAFAQSPDQIIDPDAVNNFALQQVLVSTPQQFQQSALHGGVVTIAGNSTPISDKSVAAHIVGLIQADGVPLDVRPRNGRGIGVYGTAFDVNGMPFAINSSQIHFDYNGDYDGTAATAEADGTSFRINFSAVASGTGAPFDLDANPQFGHFPDVDYTYPDINSPFLAYDVVTQVDLNANGTIEPAERFRVVIPSYHRPQLFPDERTAGFANIFTQAATAAKVLRPHSQHVNSDGSARYIDPATYPTGRPALSGDRNRIISPFPFTTDLNGGTPNEMGVFSSPTSPYELDVDADGDGILDSIWLDLDHPLVELAGGRQAVPIFYVKVVDMDALLNVNHHGHDPLFTALSNNGAADAFTHVYSLTNGWIHASNTGAGPAEINPLPALSADPASTNYVDTTPANVLALTQQQRGMYADLTGPTDRTNDGTAPDGFTRAQMANTELWRLLHGATVHRNNLSLASTNANSDVSGRYGELVVGGVPVLRNALASAGAIYPSAGDTLLDDDGDDNNPANNGATAPDDNYATGVAHQDNLLAPALSNPRSVHPRDFTGLGNYPISTLYPALGLPYGSTYRNLGGGFGGGRDLAGPSTSFTNPSRWPLYGTQTAPLTYQMALWANQGSGEDSNLNGILDPNESDGALTAPMDNGDGVLDPYSIYGIQPWLQAGGVPGDLQVSQLPLGTAYDGLRNENDEITSDPNFPTQVDAPFPPSELAALHPGDAQWQLIREDSRLRKLANFNFEANRQAASIRQQFTTDSRDRLEHGHARVVSATRQWEFNDNLFLPNEPRFPPAFGGATSRHEGLPPGGGVPFIIDEDPFRPVTRRLLTIEEDNQTNIGGFRHLPGQKLNLNRLLVNFDRNGNPIYRHLTPHATFQLGNSDANRYLTDGVGGVRPVAHLNDDTITQSYYDDGQALSLLDPDIPVPPSAPTYAAVPFAAITTDKFAQEAWARYDRQRMARDIYTLLYTVGAPDTDSLGVPFDPTTTAYTGADANSNGVVDSLEAMAQFAANYVDALDQDDVITRFEYDTNLSDGWNNPPSPGAFVLGVEAQQLTLSEVLLIQQPSATTDNDGTLHNENRATQVEQRWLYVELRNATPLTVRLPTGSYRLARYAANETARTGATPPVATSQFMTHPTDADLPLLPNPKRIPPGEHFLIACHDGLVVNPAGPATSDFYADIDADAPELEAIIPANSTVVASSSVDPVATAGAPHVDLDLLATDAMGTTRHEQYYANTNTLGGVALVEPGATNAEPQQFFQLRLERRLNTNGFNFGEDTWVEVDQIEVAGQQFSPGGSSSASMTAALSTVASTERRQSLDEFITDNTDPGVVKHSISSVVPAKHTGNWAWGSVNGGDRTAGFTLWQPHFNRDFSSVYELLSIPVVGPDRLVRDIADDSNNRLSGWVDSSAALRAPFAAAGVFQFPDGDTNLNNTPDAGEVSNRWYRLLEFIEYPPRSHDTIRDGQSVRRRTDGRLQLNTLRHEAIVAGLVDDAIQLQDTSAARPALDRHDAARNWFDQLLLARDGLDPLANLPLPGVPGSLPFRSMSYINPQRNDLVARSTLLRTHRPTGGASDSMQLFEARGSADISGDNAINNDLDNVDYHTRNRLLAKIANNTTNRSHVFAMWVGYELFEAHQPNPAVPDVVQIGARIEDLPGHREFVVADMTRLEEAWVDDPNDGPGRPGRFDFRKFIIYRKRIK